VQIAPSTIHRPRIAAWLERHAGLPLRALIAPAGYGKTTELVRYLQGSDHPHAYVRAVPADTPGALAARVAQALNLEAVASFDELRAAMESMRCTIAVDALDLASIEAISALGTFALGGPRRVRTIVAGCRTGTVATPRLYAQGLAATLGRDDLAFTAEDVEALCELLGVDRDAAGIRALVCLSDGWPLVACGVVRSAEGGARALESAYGAWIAANAAMLRDFVDAEVRRADERAAAAFARVLCGEEVSESEWMTIENAGLFAIERDGAPRLLHPVAAAYTRGPGLGGAHSPMPLAIALFGAFEVRYGGSPVRWMRRRDMEIVRALAFRPAGASRDELVEQFWPQTERRAAQQSLRTACSYIRKAIANAVGERRVDRYFTAGKDVVLHADAISLDAHRFSAHAHRGDEALAAGRAGEAIVHYRAAKRLHAGAPAIDPNDPEQAAFTARLGETLERISTRLRELEERGARTDDSTFPPSQSAPNRAAS
jgi:DNA-binding SARP family transcriptional activator